MLVNIALGCLLVVVSTVVHAGGTLAVLQGLRITHAEHWARRSMPTRVTVVGGVVLLMFAVTLAEAAVWAGTYLVVGAAEGVERTLYFSIVTYTTLGYGDIVLGEDWRLLASLQAAIGIIMFGWTTALIVAAVQRVYGHPSKTGGPAR